MPTIEQARAWYADADPVHDFNHIRRVLALAERLAPRRALAFIPSPSGLGIAMVLPASNALAIFLGAFLAWGWRRWWRASAERYVTPVASGLIAGESLMGVAIALLVAAGLVAK